MKKLILSIIYIALFTPQVFAQQNFGEWKQAFISKASQQGISPLLIQQLERVTPYPKAVKSDKNQSEFKKFLWDYLKTAASNSRIKTGKQALDDNRGLLSQITKKTGVSPQYILGIWGLESNFGQYTGNVPVISAMATLAFDGRRKAFFETEIIALLHLIQQGDISQFNVKGSWAGGLGLTQFIPTSYQRYAVDFNQDGKRNLWQVSDALASTANYLKSNGWMANQSWGKEVKLPQNFNYLLANDKNKKLSIKEWKQLGVSSVNGSPLTSSNHLARLFVPAGRFGPKFLLLHNFDIIKTYNNSDAYALGVAMLGDRIFNKPSLSQSWPKNAFRMTQSDIKKLQQRLNEKGFDTGKPDGIFGNKTRRAIQYFQANQQQVADGFVTYDVYQQIIL